MRGIEQYTWTMIIMFLYARNCHTNIVTPLCDAASEECYTKLIVKHGVTNGAKFEATRQECTDGGTNPAGSDAGPIADGYEKYVVLYNNSLPGPPIVVYENQQVVVRVINHLRTESTTVHWHGLHQRGTPWMDGAEGVSQCAINPSGSFTYRFIASPIGTHWYHSHQGTQRTMGAAGPFIVLPRSKERSQELRGDDPIPEFDEEFYLMVSDWMRNDSIDIAKMIRFEMVSYPYGFDTGYCFNSTKQPDGVDCGVFPFMSGLINGRGRHYIRDTDIVENMDIDLEKFKVKKGGKYRFRAICSSMTFGFRLSIDGHELNIIASDGRDIKTVKAESLIVFGGERFDFWIEASDLDNIGSYWIRAETLERFQNGLPKRPGHVEAILQYEGYENEPTSKRRECNETHICKIVNCPFGSFPESEHLTCVLIADLESTHVQENPNETGELHEEFLNYHFVGMDTTGYWKPSINGYRNALPSTPYQIQLLSPMQQKNTCNVSECIADTCVCPHVLNLSLGTTVQLVLTITISNPVGVLNGNTHQVHIHGHSVQVVKMGLPSYQSNNFFKDKNQDIKCLTKSCNVMRWANASWEGGNIPGMNLATPPLKDTLVVPVGGYVVVRFKADNPGHWYSHCHTEFHNAEGMSLVLKEGEESEMPSPPENLPVCGSFEIDENSFNETTLDQCSALRMQRTVEAHQLHIAAVVFAALILAEIAALAYCSCDWKLTKGQRSNWQHIDT